MNMKLLRVVTAVAALLHIDAAHCAESVPSAAFRKIQEDYWVWTWSQHPMAATINGIDGYGKRNEDASIGGQRRRQAELQEFIRRLEAVPDAELNGQERLNRSILLRYLRGYATRLGFPQEWVKLKNDSGWHVAFASVPLMVPMFTKAHFERYMGWLNDYPRYNAEAIETSREVVRLGMTPPCDTLQRLEGTIRAHVTDDLSKSVFMKPFERRPASISDADWASLKTQAETAVRGKVVPAYKELLNFYTKEYAPKCRHEIGASATPNGAAYYAHLVNVITTTDLTPEQIHKIGLDEVARIRSEMDAVAKRAGFQGDRKAFIEMLRTEPRFYAKSPEELLMRVGALAKQIDGELPKLFSHMPRLPYTVMPIPKDKAEGTTTAYYLGGSLKAGRAGIYAVNTSKLDQRPLFELPALTLHEAVPGHHFQGSLQEELDLPDVRRELISFIAFTEGWALYAERLGYDMGLYEDPYAEFGRLSYEMWRACRLVVDTGIHSKGWTKQQAIDFMLENTALSRHNIEAEVNRYISWPGQALGYKIGEIKIRELRAKAEKALGEKFDIRAFHDAVLENGSVPLDVLEAHIDQWIAGQQKKAA